MIQRDAFLEGVILDVRLRLEKRMQVFPPCFPAERNGIRLGLAAIEDQLKETLAEWHDEKKGLRRIPWERTYDELLDVIVVAIYTAIDMHRVIAEARENARVVSP